ncbi:MAG: ABC transporter substrate-binding protein [Anaerolineae bacterium]|nr:ABC transporter substrate-binding protein [Anaerolineae bacterium]
MSRLHSTPALSFLVMLLSFTLSACQPAPSAALSASGPVTVELSLGFRPDVQFAPVYVGIEKGFFTEAGFEVTIAHRSESDSAREVALNEPGSEPLKAAVISGEQVLLARAQGLPIRYGFEWFQRFPVAIASREAAGIAAPADLAGHSVGVPMLEGASYIGLEALLASAGLSDADIDLTATGFTQVETLLTGQVEAVVIYANNEPVQLAERGEVVNVIMVSDYADLVSNGLIFNENRYTDDTATLKAFVAAFSAALEYTIDNPDEAFEISKQYVEGLDDPEVESIARQVLESSLPLWQAERLGETTPESWGLTSEVLVNAGLLDPGQEIEGAYTNDLLP